jgi:3-hydroxyisobutyrate dehydrogenase-like beta-hydroxyacid dehydrogenase
MEGVMAQGSGLAKESVGFIGVGLMGHGMAKNIVEKGFPLTVLAHRNREPVEDLKSRGAKEAKTAREVAAASEVVVLCVTGSPQVEAVINGADGLASAGKPLLICDSSTSDPSSTIRLAAELSAKGITLIDTPLGRTPKDAAEGTLDVMVGGEEAVVERARPILEAFAKRVIRTGPTGSGHTMKLLNNFLSLGYAAIYSEALTMGVKAGLTPQVFDSVIKGGRMDCGFYQTFMRWTLDRDPNAHKFTLGNALKDLTYLSAFANSANAANPIGAAVRNSFALAHGAGRAQDFVPMLADVVAEVNGTSLTGERKG